ncbi:MAG: 16S rRNA (adenine(1518)-N(6)/adenine(1519)-N(6))-dimethyltransferase RsmA [Gammaproteobacteria bacterium]|nr:16S rRNA (adenine(1518)-N(6)/adenine(1519)-N(6))-dimethyltransferase RsmA [Gammaproteobacteria bacterium]MCY4355919.1 16S rRNA (adenine(1518)-N(6)/adenine(1519)-N(6))-dimethyltransferase RsmA [Gammaproteobacteria bacterium]
MTQPHKQIRLANGMPHPVRKRFGQHFLHDQAVINRLIDAVHPKAGEHLLEIGPGRGALTEPLVTSGARLDCVEIDRDLAASLKDRYASSPLVNIHQQDILKFDVNSLIDNGDSGKSLRIIGNLPYNISTPVLFYLLRFSQLIRDMTFMLQLEVVQRLTAVCGDRNYGRLGLMVRYYCHTEHLFNVPSAAFSPRPKVSSAIVRLTPHQDLPLPVKNVGTLDQVLRTAFSQRRKTLRNSLKTLISEAKLQSLAIDYKKRPETLQLADFVAISDALDTGAKL